MARSTLYAVALSFTYCALASAYILVSSGVAADRSASIEELRRLEVQKGLAYVGITTLLAFLGARTALRRMAQDGEELLRRERALVASQGKVFAGAMAASVAHDANNVLFAILGDLEAMSQAEGSDRELHLTQLHHSVNRLVALNRRLLAAARPEANRQQPSGDLALIVRDSIASVRAHKSLRGCRIVCKGLESLPMAVEPLLVHQIVSNLVLNAGEATEGRGTIEVVLGSGNGRASIEVHDDGPGVPAERRATLFESLHTTKPEGAGLGLFSARACAQGMQGSIEVLESPLGGALFRVRLPLAAEPAAVSIA